MICEGLFLPRGSSLILQRWLRKCLIDRWPGDGDARPIRLCFRACGNSNFPANGGNVNFSRPFHLLAGAIFLCLSSTSGCARQTAAAKGPAAADWTFAVSGDSRNCGNMVMPAIAAGARAKHAAFYWHLGDLRAIYKVDEDYVRERRFANYYRPPSIGDYLLTAWTDFSQHQVRPFGDMPFFLGIGNHELLAPKTRNQFLIEFEALLDRPELKEQRSKDAALLAALHQSPAPRTYFHWVERNIDFINLDNASDDAFDVAQLAWLDALLDADLADPHITTIVVGMHESLPYSKSDGHSMCMSMSGRSSGLHVYARLAQANRTRHVYVLSSHSHFYLADIYATDHWRDAANGGVVLPGWVVGTAGAERYALPAEVTPGADAREHVYGYMTGKVAHDGTIAFAFHELGEAELQAVRSPDYGAEDVAFCVAQNPDPKRLEQRPPPVTCEAAQER
jgi:hypothetical protein